MKPRTVLSLAVVFCLLALPQAARGQDRSPNARFDGGSLSRLGPPGESDRIEAMPGWSWEADLAVGNSGAATLPTGYTVGFTVNTAGLIAQGRMRSDCADLRVAFAGATEIELDRLVESCNSSGTVVRFRTQADIAAGASDTRYRMYFGNTGGTNPPANPSFVYAFYDDFQDGDSSGWTAKGTWGVVNDGGNYVYRYTGGGANWAISSVALPGMSDLDYVARIRAAATTTWIGLAFRIKDQGNAPSNNFLTFYESRDGSVFKYARVAADNHSVVGGTPAFTMTTGVWYRMRVQAIGSTVRARIWQDGTTEPTAWTISTTDVTYQAETNIGATLYYHTTAADWDDFQVRKLVAVEPTVTIQWGAAPWWDAAWGYRLPLEVANTSASAVLPVRYSARLVLDTNALISAGQLLPSCNDLRILSFDGVSSTEIDRVVEGCGTAQTDVWFALQRPILAGGRDTAYYAYYGNGGAGAPPASKMNVFLFFEDWEQGTTHWTNAGGLDPSNTGTMGQSVISAEQSVSPSNSQKFPVKAAGGDAFSGYIPALPNTTYSFRAWAKSATDAYVPVGINSYTSAFGLDRGNFWLWTNEWTVGSPWSSRSSLFTTTAATAYIKIVSEWWLEGPGTTPVYMDDLMLRYGLASEPTVTAGTEETNVVAPEITNVQSNGPVEVGSQVTVTATVSTAAGTVDSVTLKVLSPVAADVAMSLVSGDGTSGTWRAYYTPPQGGAYGYRILAHATSGGSKLSTPYSFTATDTTPPVITPVSVIDPILVRNTQTVTVQVADNGQVGSVTITLGANTYPMTAQGSQYSYSWLVTTVGTIGYTVTAQDTVGNQATLPGSFQSRARDVEVCTWRGCKTGAASWSCDDSNSNCKTDLEAAGFRGTYYVMGASSQAWYTTYSYAGHEIGAHTVGHPCDASACGTSCASTCTPVTVWECPYTTEQVDAYRQDQLEPNIASIEAATGKPVLSGAWPCGCADARRMTAASYYLLGERGYNDCGIAWVQDVNGITPTEFMNINGLHAYAQSYVDQAISEGKWVVVTSHGLCDGIAYMGSRSSALWLAPVGDVIKYIKARNTAQTSNYSRVGRTITLDAVHGTPPFLRPMVDGINYFPPVVFDYPVTLKVHVEDTDQVLSVTVDGSPVSYAVATMEGARYVLVDAPLDVLRHIAVNLGAPAPTIGTIVDNGPIELGSQAQVAADVTISEGSIQSVTLRVLSPEAGDYPMSLVPGSSYRASFVPGQAGPYSYRVIASNAEGTTSQSDPRTLTVQDTTPPSWRNQAQSRSTVPIGATVTLSAEGRDIGGLRWAILATDESGSWTLYDWPISDWWNHAWAHRRAVGLTETAGQARTAATIDVAVSSADFPGLASCAAELRVADTSRVEVPSQVYDEQSSGGGVTCRLLFQASVPASGSRTYYVYYGNPSATPPAYTTDLTSTASSGGVAVANSFFDVFLDADSGIISSLRLPQGSNLNLPLSPETDWYWGWHQVCSGVGNLTGKNRTCVGGTTSASGLVPETVLDGPIANEFAYTIVRGTATYRVAYRFFAGSPYYRYTLGCSGTGCASVMNDYWLMNGYFTALGDGAGGTPSTTYNSYDSGGDHVRIASFASIDHSRIDGTDNDGAFLGALLYDHPTASALDLYVTTAESQVAIDGVLAKIAAPLGQVLGAVQDAPVGQYGSPMDMGLATDWTASSFAWRNPAIAAGTNVSWRIRYCDQQGLCTDTDDMAFAVRACPDPPETEVCNGIDDDCDGLVDDADPNVTGRPTWYRDADGDGYGNAAITQPACAQPAGYVANDTDCNDADAAIHPGAAEVCDGIDQNCNGSVDEGVLVTSYQDADADTFGNPAVSTQGCTVPTGYVTNSLDCDDSNPAIQPGATELCNGLDDDCNPATPDGSGEAGYGTACDGPDADLCKEGIYICTGGPGLVCNDTSGDTLRADAVVLVNSSSDAYADFQRLVQPYLDHFGVPYTVVDIAAAPVPADVCAHALVIVGHRRLDPAGAYLDGAAQALLADSVSAGTGLVNFDNDLWSAASVPRYAFVNTVFGFGYDSAMSGSGVAFPDPQAHYITARHASGESISTGTMTLAGITLAGSLTSLANSTTSTGSQPILVVAGYGQGRGVQFGSYDWMSSSVKGPMYGLDDLVWRSLVWAARKPFVMQGLPPFLTMRIDDENGPFQWIHIANEFGFKPWAGLFIDNIDDSEAADLSSLVRAGMATTSIHAYGGSFFYFDYNAGTDFSDSTVAANFAYGTSWHAARNIPISEYVLPHVYAFGTNVFGGLKNWGVEFVGTQMDPGNVYGVPWIMNGPFRKYETGSSGSTAPLYYADFMTIPGHPELNGTFFNCVTEIRDDLGYEWTPNLNNVPYTINHGTLQTKRALDAMAISTLFTHAFYVSGAPGGFVPANWRAILQGITTNLASYNPINVTMEDACRYARAMRTSDISSAIYDPGAKRITANFTGKTDIPTMFYLFTGEGSAISHMFVDVPQFNGTAQVDFVLPGPLDHIEVTPNPASVVAGGSRQLTAAAYDEDGNPIPNQTFVWSVVNGGGTIDASGRFTAGVTAGTYTNTVVASYGAVQGFATVEVTEPVLDHFTFATLGTPKYKDLPFTVTITARDAGGNRILGYTGTATLSDTTGTITPTAIGPFVAGVGSAQATITATATGVTLTALRDAASGVSNPFDVTTGLACPCSLFPGATPGTPHVADYVGVELGVKFRASTDGYITALRFYKAAADTGSHVGHLWDGAGTLLATATFTGETASGWQQVSLDVPVSVRADTTYVASYHTSTGYPADRNGFGISVDRPPLRALRDGEEGGNGVHKYDSACTSPPCFPNDTVLSSNYYADVVFATDLTPPPLPCADGTCRIWDDSVVPPIVSMDDTQTRLQGVELGVKFRSSVAGYITGIEFYQGPLNPGPHPVSLWARDGTLLVQAQSSDTTPPGWQHVTFETPVQIQAGTIYIASYHTWGQWSVDWTYFASGGHDNPPLRALASGEDGGNGVYAYGPLSFPSSSGSSNYWVDVMFTTTAPGPDTTPPTVTAVSPLSGASGVALGANVTATFSEAMAPATITEATFTLRPDSGGSALPAVVTYSGRTATLDPDGTLLAGTTYRATVFSTVTDDSNNALGTDYAWTFTTGLWGTAPWWDPAWGYRLPVTVTNSSASAALPVHYSVRLTLDTSTLIAAGQMLPSCADLRALSFDGLVSSEIDRIVWGCNTTQTEVWFALQRPIPAAGQDVGYYIYYGDPASGAPLADGMNVFLYFEDWEQDATHWTNAGGFDAGNTGTMGHSLVSGESYVSPSNSQKFPQKITGGDAFSGYVPVTPGTGYALRAWAKSATAAYLPVGFDPYTSGYAKGAEVWLWTNEWTIGTQWTSREASFTTSSTTAYVKIKSEWWLEGPGTEPVYLDDLSLRYASSTEPTVTAGGEETSLPAPVISSIHDTGPVEIHSSIDVFADVSSTSGTVDAVTLKILTPVTADVTMALVSGDGTSGTWKASYTPSQGGTYSYRILAHSTAGRSRLSASQSFTATDTTAPVITLVSVIDPILVKNTQTLVVQVTDNGLVSAVALTSGGSTYPMTRAGDQYSYSWQVGTVGTIAYTVTATDSVGNTSTLTGSFQSQAREVDVCTWKGCKAGAASWSCDDSNNSCKTNVEAAGFRGTYYVNGSTPQQWYTDYAAAGHEIGAHTVGHPCDSPCCAGSCTPASLALCDRGVDYDTSYRASQFEPNIAAIETATGVPVLSGAWPCGCTDGGRMTAASYYLLGNRGYNDCSATWTQDVNLATPVEFMNLNGLHTYDQTYIDRAINEGKWVIVTSHGECTGIDYMGSRSGVLWLAPVGEVLKYIKVRNAAQLSNYSRAGRTIAFDVVHNLPAFRRQKVDLSYFLDVVFDDPVTLKVHILDSDQVLGVTVNDVPLAPSAYSVATIEGARYLLFDASLQSSRHVLVTLSAPAPTIGAVTDTGPVELGSTAQVTAVVTIEEGSVQSVTLRLLSPEAADYPMTLVQGTTDNYSASFLPGRLGQFSYRVLATNAEGNASESAVRNLLVQDTTSPEWRNQAQSVARMPVGGTVTLSAEGRDIGGLGRAILATDESGSWQEFDWPVSDWWNHSWAHRRAVTLTETAGLDRTSETVDLAVSSVDYPGLSSCANELRVADTSRAEVPSQVDGEQNVGGVVTCHLLFRADVDANSSSAVYVYYGNPSAAPPSYATDLTSSSSGGGVTVQSSFFDVFLDADSGIISRVRLPQGTGTNLPLSPEMDSYWGWHQVCSGAGNLTGKNSLCFGGTAPATGLVLQTTLDGPIAKEFTYTIVRGAATYATAYRFLAGSSYYQYTAGCTGTGCTAVMNNYWYANGNYSRLGDGAGGAPATTYATYDSGTDHVRIASFAAVDHTTIDGGDNDGNDLGGPEYRQPTAASLNLYVTTASSQGGTEGVLARIASPLGQALGAVEDAPAGQYGSPADLNGATGWTPSAFTWSNPAVPNGTTVQWRIRYCDLQNNCATTSAMSFLVQNAPIPTSLSMPGDATGGFHANVWVPISAALPPPPDTPDIYGIDMAIQYDPAVLEPIGVLPSAAAAAAGFAVEYNLPIPGSLLISEYSGQNPVPYAGGEIARVEFYVKGGVGTSSTLAFVSARINETLVDPANLHNGRLGVTCSGSPDGTPCNADNNVCTDNDSCQLGVCTAGPPLNCDDGKPCTVDSCDAVTGCGHVPGNAGTVCRVATGPCDVAENCDGTQAACPSDAVAGTEAVCRSAAGDCDVAENCDGSNKACPADVFMASSTVCRPAAGDCDVAESCTGSSASCPADGVRPGGDVCRPSTDPCDGVETCDGTSKACPADVFICGISGTVFYYRDAAGSGSEPSAKPVPNVGIQRTQDLTVDTRTTDASGAYAFTNLLGSMSVTTLAKHDDPPWAPDVKAAITSTDAAHIAFAAVGIETLSPNQIFAGDVTGNGTISALDASNVARFAAELVDHFPVAGTAGSDWRFLKCAPSYPDNCGAPIYDFTPLVGPETDRNFYAILYGDVTGNWTWGTKAFASAATVGTSPEELAGMAADRRLADRLKHEAPPQVDRRAGAPPAEMSLRGWKPLRAGERRQLTVNLKNADGILGLDLTLTYDPTRIAIVAVETAGIASGDNMAKADLTGTYRIAAYGVLPLAGSGPVLTVTVEALRNVGREEPMGISGVANEGRIPLRVQGPDPWPRGKR
jgi:hypothetical protein